MIKIASVLLWPNQSPANNRPPVQHEMGSIQSPPKMTIHSQRWRRIFHLNIFKMLSASKHLEGDTRHLPNPRITYLNIIHSNQVDFSSEQAQIAEMMNRDRCKVPTTVIYTAISTVGALSAVITAPGRQGNDLFPTKFREASNYRRHKGC